MRKALRQGPLVVVIVAAACVFYTQSPASPPEKPQTPTFDHQLFRDLIVHRSNQKPAGDSPARRYLPAKSKYVASPNELLTPPAPAEFPIPFQVPSPIKPMEPQIGRPAQTATFASFFDGPNSQKPQSDASNSREPSAGLLERVSATQHGSIHGSIHGLPLSGTDECCAPCRAVQTLTSTCRQIAVLIAAVFPPLGNSLDNEVDRSPADEALVGVELVDVDLVDLVRPAAGQSSPGENLLPAPQQDAAVTEILKIRERLQINPLAGTTGEKSERDTRREFVTALRKVVASSKTAEPLRLNVEFPEPPQDASESAQPPLNSDETLGAMLRLTGRKLDDKANEFEEQKNYDRADELRELAYQIRHQARRLGEGGSKPTPRYYRR